MSDETPSRITISRDALRADLAEMELRLRVYFDDQLRQKASEARVAVLESRMGAHERGEFTEAWSRRIAEIAEQTFHARDSEGWSRRERVMAVLSAVTTVAMFVFSVLIALSGGGKL